MLKTALKSKGGNGRLTMTFEKEREFEELLESAYHHTVNELGLENVKPSFRREFEKLQKAHNAIHEFMLLARMLIPSQDDGPGWHGKSAFLIYQWEEIGRAHV